MMGFEAVEAAVKFAHRFAVGYKHRPAVALLAGSRAKGTSKRNSDYDFVFLYDDLPGGAWREMVSFEEESVEVFAHDLRTLKYFFRQSELPSGEASLACMVDEGVAIIGAGDAIESTAKELARSFLASGPPPLSDAVSFQRRYAITNMAAALHDAGSNAERFAIGSALYPALADFALLANGHWTARGKALPAALHGLDADLEQAFTVAFEQSYLEGEDTLLQSLIDEILRPFGGPLRDGFRQQAPPSWRD